MPDATSELENLRAELAALRAELARSNAVVSASEALIAGLKLEIAMLKRDKYGRSAERTARLIDQLELQLEELETAAAEDAIRAEQAEEKATKVAGFERRKPVKKPFPEHLPRERVVVDAPSERRDAASAKCKKRRSARSRSADLHPPKMLHDARMAGLVKLRCGIVTDCGGRLRADLDDQAAPSKPGGLRSFAAAPGQRG
jgi:chromosome segregation ATPase